MQINFSENYNSFFQDANQNLKNLAKLTTTSLSAFALGAIKGGFKLGVISGVLGAIDEIAVLAGYSQNYYISSAIIGAFAASKLELSTRLYLTEILGAAAGAAFASGMANELLNPIPIAKSAYALISNISDNESIGSTIQKQVITATALGFSFRAVLDKHFSNRGHLISFNNKNYDQTTPQDYTNYFLRFLKSSLLIASSQILLSTTGIINNYLAEDLGQDLQKKLTVKLFNNDNLGKIAKHSNASYLLDNLPNDIRTISLNVVALQNSKIEQFIIAYSAFTFFLSTKTFDLPILLYLYSNVNLLNQFLSTQIVGFDNQLKLLDSKISDTNKIIKSKSDSVIRSGGVEFLAQKISELNQERFQINNKKDFFKTIQDNWLRIKPWLLDNLIGQSCVGFKSWVGQFKDSLWYKFIGGNLLEKILNPKTAVDAKTTIMMKAFDIIQFIDWFGKSSGEVKTIESTIERLSKIIDILQTKPQCQEFPYLGAEQNEESRLELRNFKITDENDNQFYIDLLNITKGVNSVSANLAIQNAIISTLTEHSQDKLCVDGSAIVFSNSETKPNIRFIGTQPFIPPHSTLLDVLLYPQTLEQVNLKESAAVNLAKNLFNLLKISASSEAIFLKLEENLKTRKSFWKSELSSDTQKKLSLISILMQGGADILILEEPFQGIDEASAKILKQLIKNHMKNGVIIAFDQSWQNPDNQDFYDRHIDLRSFKNSSSDIYDHEIEISISGEQAPLEIVN